MLNMMVMSYHTYVVVCSKCCTVFVFFVKKKFGSRKMAGRGGQETCDKKTDWWLQEGKKGKGSGADSASQAEVHGRVGGLRGI